MRGKLRVLIAGVEAQFITQFGQKRREDEHPRLKDEVITEIKKLQGFAGRLIRMAGLDFRPGPDGKR